MTKPLGDRIKCGIKGIIRQNHKSPVFAGVARVASSYLKAYHNENYYEFERNGEAYAIDAILAAVGKESPVIFDVGAHTGHWTIEVLNRCPEAAVHCFEIAPPLLAELSATLTEYPNVSINEFGLSDTAGEVEIHFVPDSRSITSIHRPVLSDVFDVERQTLMANIDTGDRYCDDKRITSIDLLKIDTEGHDFAVLTGFRHLLKSGGVKCIQFEHGFVHISSRKLLADFFALLEPLGFKIGRVYPKSVAFKDYEPARDEQFRMGNYIAVHESQTQILNALMG